MEREQVLRIEENGNICMELGSKTRRDSGSDKSESPVVPVVREHSNVVGKVCIVRVVMCASLGRQIVKKCCKMFCESSPCLLGQHSSCSTAQRHVELSENILQDLSHNLRHQTPGPDRIGNVRVRQHELTRILVIEDWCFSRQ